MASPIAPTATAERFPYRLDGFGVRIIAKVIQIFMM